MNFSFLCLACNKKGNEKIFFFFFNFYAHIYVKDE